MLTSSPLCFNDVLNSDQVPSLPEMALRIIEIAQQPDPDPHELIRTVRADPATAGRLMKFANSALFGLRHKSASIEAAVPMLGTTLVRTLVLGFYLARQTPESKSLHPWHRQIWREALFQASAAEVLAERTDGADPPTWFLAGLLQEVGQLAILNATGEDYVENVLKDDSEQTRIEREMSHFGFSHVDVSIALCQQWNLEPRLVTAISSHHDVAAALRGNAEPHMANGLAAAASCCEYIEAVGSRLNAARSNVERMMVESFGFFPDEIPPVLAEIDARAIELAHGFSISVSKPPMREALLEEAQAVLRQIAIESRLQILQGMSRKPGNTPANSGEWLDEDTRAYSCRFLDTALPQELEKSHADGASVGLLEVDFSDLSLADGVDFTPSDLVNVITDCVRPDDCVIRSGDGTAVIILQRLNFDVLHRIAERIQAELNRKLNMPEDTRSGLAVGGVVVVPAGRKAVATAKVLKTLSESANSARQLSSTGIAFQILTGKKAQRLEKHGDVR